MKISVIGAGIFGCLSALKLREKFPNAKITIFEKGSSILSAASGINQYRLHRGYHYPRSNETVEQAQEGIEEFEREFSKAIVDVGYERFYCIAKEGSLVSADEYLTFLERSNLPYNRLSPNLLPIHADKVDIAIQVKENAFDAGIMYLEMTKKLKSARIEVRRGERFDSKKIKEFDLVINCTYSNLNEILPEDQRIDYQFELCEKPIVSLGKEWQKKSIVIMDGEFGCIDPLGSNQYFHVMGHVKEAIHDRQVGNFYKIPNGFSDVLNMGACKTSLSRFPFILNGCSEFFNFEGKPVVPQSNKGSNKMIGGVFYNGSMFTIRTVLPNREHDDARPSQITKHSEQLYSVFGGKIATSVSIANKLKEMI